MRRIQTLALAALAVLAADASIAVAGSQRRSPIACENVTLSGSAAAWTNPGNAMISDNSRATTPKIEVGQYTDALVCRYQFDFPAGSANCRFNVQLEASNAYGWAKIHELRIRRPTGSLSASHYSISGHWTAADQSYGYPTYSSDGPEDYADWGQAAAGIVFAACDPTAVTCPGDPEGPTVMNVNHSGVGVHLAAEIYPGQGAGYPRIDQLELLVWCDEPPPAATPTQLTHHKRDIPKASTQPGGTFARAAS